MTTHTSKAPERFRHSAQNPHKLVGHPEGEWVSFTDFAAMQARAKKAGAENERLRALMRRAHTLMLECGWQLAPASDLASGDGILEAVVAEVEDEFRAALERKEGGT